MKLDRKSMQLYAVTDRSWSEEDTLKEKVSQAIAGGITFLQIREKDMEESEYVQSARVLCELAKQQGIPVVINDNVQVAIQSGADGVHIGQEDGNVMQTRQILGKDKILGVSVHTLEEALLAQEQGADYLGVGAVFSTTTKQDASLVQMDTLQAICKQVHIPVVAIGGIQSDNVSYLAGTGIDGVAVVSAIFKPRDVKEATKELKIKVTDMLQMNSASTCK